MHIGVCLDIENDVELQQTLFEGIELVIQIRKIRILVIACNQINAANGWLLDNCLAESDEITHLMRCPNIGVLDRDCFRAHKIRADE